MDTKFASLAKKLVIMEGYIDVNMYQVGVLTLNPFRYELVLSEDLLVEWMSTTHALTSVGYGTQLYQELQAAQNSQSDHYIAIQNVSMSKRQTHLSYYHNTAEHADNLMT